mgnify:FL=1
MAFHMDRMVDLVLTGKSTIKVTRVDDKEPMERVWKKEKTMLSPLERNE